MSTPDYDMAPPAATVTAPPPAAVQPLVSGAATTTDPNAQRPQRRRSASQKDDRLAGALIPGGVITGLISLCWMVHQFGLPVVIFALLAAAATATAAVAIKVGRRAAKAASRNRGGRGAGGAGPGAGRSGGGRAGGGRSGGGRAPGLGGHPGAGNRSGGIGPSRRSGGGSRGSNTPGPLSRKPGGMGSLKSPSGRGGTGTAPRSLNKGGLGGAKSAAGPKPFKGSGSLFNGGKRSNGSGFGAFGGGSGKAPKQPRTGTGLGSILSRKGSGSGTGTGTKGPSPTPKKRKPSGAGTDGAGAASSGDTKTPKKTPGGTTALGGPKGGKTPGLGKGKGGSGSTGKTPKNPVRKTAHVVRKTAGTIKTGTLKTTGAVKKGYTKVTSPKFRRGMHKAATPFRAVFRGTRKHGGKFVANVMRWGGRMILSVNTALGTVRYSTMGPNWLRPLSRVLHFATSPLADLVNRTRSWTWLNAWVYRTATARPLPAAGDTPPTLPSAPTAGTGTAAPAPPPGAYAPVPSPASAPPGGVPPMDTSPVHHAYPLIYAADAIRMAAAAFASAPADSMKGYEAVIENLGHLEVAMCHLLHDIAEVTENDFKVNPHIPDQYRTLAVHFLMLGAFVDQAHTVYREIHAEQLENIENPTWQGRKWDLSENWAHVMPQFAWTDPTVHAMPLLLASGAIRDAGIHIRLHPSGTMFGYEMTIEHLAPLAEALHDLMITVADVTETEFRVHPAITEMHRDAGQRFRDLGSAIQGVHLMYRVLHAEQLHNLENPSYQAAKWDQSRNA
ncbi:hypothetical protein ACF1AE_21780 [Streptomyces sp. NPDC014986]|uniref:hypothetical protein n=1 Tax=Streptomyces sp. NPDC014986 TaxID=3364934 RepID=UPI0037015F2D